MIGVNLCLVGVLLFYPNIITYFIWLVNRFGEIFLDGDISGILRKKKRKDEINR